MSYKEKIEEYFYESIDVKTNSVDLLAKVIEEAALLMVDSINSDCKIISCGNGGSAADAQHFSAELLNRYQIDRPPLPAIAITTDTSTLTSIGNDFSYDLVFSKQIEALGKEGDILLAISTSGNSSNIIEAVKAAHEKGIIVVALTGKDGGDLTKILQENDIEIRVPSQVTARIQEVHILIIHCLCALIDTELFGEF